MNAIYCVKSLKKIQDFNGVWTRHLAIPVRYSNQLSYEATDVALHTQTKIVENAT